MGETQFGFGRVYIGDEYGNYFQVTGLTESVDISDRNEDTPPPIFPVMTKSYEGTMTLVSTGNHEWARIRKLLFGWKRKSPMRMREIARALRMAKRYSERSE